MNVIHLRLRLRTGLNNAFAGATCAIVMSVLLLGCGLVAPPVVKYLVGKGHPVTIATRTIDKAHALAKTSVDPSKVSVVFYDIETDVGLSSLEILVSEPRVKAAKVAIRHQKHFCTTSYVSDEMQSLDAEARKQGVLLLNEIGVDPGLDHMSAMKIINELKKQGAKLVSFRSVCGGLPAPEFNDNPFGYKFSWSPRGVLLAGNNSAWIRLQGSDVSIPGTDLVDEKNVFVDHVDGIGKFEWYYNRDSIKYLDIYKIPDTPTIMRGTYRYPGWSRILHALKSLGFTSVEKVAFVSKTPLEFVSTFLSIEEPSSAPSVIAEKLRIAIDDAIIEKLTWLGFFDEKKVLPAKVSSPIDFLGALMQSALVYKDGEKDMIVMKHEFEVETSAAERYTLTSTLVSIGDQPSGDSAMARTVTLPLAIAVHAILTETMNLTGVVRPTLPEIYVPVLREMESFGVKFVEKRLPTLFWLRDEVKPGEQRAALGPEQVKILIERGYRVVVESSTNRCFSDQAYIDVGCTLVPPGSWVDAPASAIIVGLKELHEEYPQVLKHRHIYFAHCYKGQAGWDTLLKRFKHGHGMIWDLEFLVDDSGRRVAAFGRAAGIVGAAVAAITWAKNKLAEPIGVLKPWSSSEELVKFVKDLLGLAGTPVPKALVLGALGRCGGGACWFFEQVGIPTAKWDVAETRRGGPFNEMLDHDLLVNCIYLQEKIAPFVSKEMLEGCSRRNLSVFCDVSCDSSNPNNPFPIYSRLTSLDKPVDVVPYSSGPLSVIAIDHLPTLIPSESSKEFASALIHHVIDVGTPKKSPVWDRAEALFFKMCEKVQ